jgi:hypothetical protein
MVTIARWVTSVVGALALLAAFAPSACAETRSVPPPSVTSVSYVAGHALPVSLLRGAWQSDSTVSNRLSLSGATVTGARSIADAMWTSSWGWTRPGRPAISLVVDVQHKPVLPGLARSSWRYELDERYVRGGPWIRFTTDIAQPYDPIFIAQWRIYDAIGSRSRIWVQFRVLFHADISSMSFESMTVRPHLLTHPN